MAIMEVEDLCTKCHAEPKRSGSSWGYECHRKATEAWRRKNKGRSRENLASWRRKNPDKVRDQQLRRKAIGRAHRALAKKHPREFERLLQEEIDALANTA